MNRQLALLLVLAASLAGSLVGDPCRADVITIDAGFDLLASPPYSTTLPNGGGAKVTSVPLPLNSYDFGSGPVGVGSTSWLQERLSTITLPTIGSSGTAPLDFLIRQVVSAQPIEFNQLDPSLTGSGYIYLTIDYSSPATGSLTVTRTSDTGGTFAEIVTAAHAYHVDGPTGPIIGSTPSLTTTISGTWQTTAPAGALVIPGINDDNFFVTQATGSGLYNENIPLYSASAVPEPSSFFTTISVGGLAALGCWWRRRRARPAA